MLSSILNWLDSRTGFRALRGHALDEPLPPGTGWAFTTGSVVALLLGCQALTGVGLSMYYVPSPSLAYDPTSQVMALRLLSGQAAVALQNEQLLSELKQTHDDLEHQAMFDALTGLANRARFVGLLGESLRHDGDEHEGTAVLFLDLNGFKAVNDRSGHDAGDELLASVAADSSPQSTAGDWLHGWVATNSRCCSTRGRNRGRADEYADAIHLALVQPFEISGEFVRVGASIGIAHSEPFITVSEMLRRADVAMYAAKGTNRDWRTVTYRIELDENERRTARLAQEFEQAFAERQFNLVYQPIVETVTGSIVGAEALIRWSLPNSGPLRHRRSSRSPKSPTTSTPSTPGSSTLRSTTSQGAVARPTSSRSSPSTSRPRARLTSLSANMESALVHRESAVRVVVELSERIVAEARGSIRNVELLTEMGLALALDDFGEGQTSLAHLRGFPITYLKLDRLFIEHAGDSSTDRKILGSGRDARPRPGLLGDRGGDRDHRSPHDRRGGRRRARTGVRTAQTHADRRLPRVARGRGRRALHRGGRRG